MPQGHNSYRYRSNRYLPDPGPPNKNTTCGSEPSRCPRLICVGRAASPVACRFPAFPACPRFPRRVLLPRTSLRRRSGSGAGGSRERVAAPGKLWGVARPGSAAEHPPYKRTHRQNSAAALPMHTLSRHDGDSGGRGGPEHSRRSSRSHCKSCRSNSSSYVTNTNTEPHKI